MFPGARLSSLVRDRSRMFVSSAGRVSCETAQPRRVNLLRRLFFKRSAVAAATIGTLELSQSVQYTYGDGSYSFSECRLARGRIPAT